MTAFASVLTALSDQGQRTADKQQRTEEGAHSCMQLTTPIEPAMAVSTAINTLSNLLQLISFIFV